MAQLADGALLDLAHAFAGDFQSTPDLFQRMVLVVDQTEAQLDDLALSLGEIVEDAIDFFAQQATVGGLDGARLMLILDDVAERVLFFL